MLNRLVNFPELICS